MTRVVVNIPLDSSATFTNRLAYVLDFIEHHPCAPKDMQLFINESDGNIMIPYGILTHELSMPNAQFCFDGHDIPNTIDHNTFTYQGLTLYGFAGQNSDNFDFEIDVFQTIFFHISRKEEWFSSPSGQDLHGMLASENHFLVQHKIHEIPVVDHLVYYFYQKIGLTPIKIETQFGISHDVDAIQKFPSFYKFIRAIANVIFYQDNKLTGLSRLFTTWYQYALGKIKDPYDTFDWLLETQNPKIKDRYLYVLSGGKTRYENYFSIKNPRIKELIQFAQSKGYVIGIHPSYNAGDDAMMSHGEKMHWNR